MPLLKTIHRWLGLGLGAFLLLQATTGLVMTHEDAITLARHPEARQAPGRAAPPLDVLFANIAAAEPQARFDRIIYAENPEVPLVARVRLPDGALRILLLDRSTGAVLTSGSIWDHPDQAAERLHTTLMLGIPGHLFLMVVGLALTFMAVTGLILWWPRPGRMVAALTIHWRAPWRRLLRDLHLAPGAIAAVFLAVTGLTGAAIIAEPLLIAAVGAVAPVSPPLNPKLGPTDRTTPVLTADQGLRMMQSRFPNGRLRQIRALGGRGLGALFVEKDAANPRTYDMAMVDRMTGQMQVFSDGARPLAGDAALAWLLPIHAGDLLGPLRPVGMTLLGLSLILASVSGAAMWIAKPRRRR